MSCAGPPERVPQCAESVTRGRPPLAPGSVHVLAGDGVEQRLAAYRAQYAHEVAAVAEGFCPVHRDAMRHVDMEDAPVAGHCSPCGRYWWYDPDTGDVGWMLDHDPATGNWHPPVKPKRPGRLWE
jgi:hypothetical protein